MTFSLIALSLACLCGLYFYKEDKNSAAACFNFAVICAAVLIYLNEPVERAYFYHTHFLEHALIFFILIMCLLSVWLNVDASLALSQREEEIEKLRIDLAD